MMGKRESKVDLEVTEYQPNEMVRIVSEAGGALWDSVFRVSSINKSQTELEMHMDAVPQNFAAKMMIKL